MLNLRILRFVWTTWGGWGGNTDMDATYLKSFKVEIQIAFSFGLSGESSMSVNFLLL